MRITWTITTTPFSGAGQKHMISAVETLLSMQGGPSFHAGPTKKELWVMKWDPYTLVVFLTRTVKRRDGVTYDGETFDTSKERTFIDNSSYQGDAELADLGTRIGLEIWKTIERRQS